MNLSNFVDKLSQFTPMPPVTLDDNAFIGVYATSKDLPTGQPDMTFGGVSDENAIYVALNGNWVLVSLNLDSAEFYLTKYQGSTFASATGTKWDQIFQDIAARADLMNKIAIDSDSMTNITNSSTAMNIVAASSTAMNAVAASSTAMNAVGASSTAMNAIMSGTETETWWGSSYYIGKGLATYASLSHTDLDGLNTVSDIAGDSTAMNDIAASSTAMDVVASSSTAMNAIMSGTETETWWGSSYYIGKGLATYASLSHTDLDGLNTVSDIAGNSTAMNDIAASSTAMNAVAASSTAMNTVATSSTAMNAVAASSTAMNAVGASSTAMNAIMSGTETETWWGSSYYIGKGLATYASLSHTDLDGLNTISDIAGDSTAMNDIAASSTAMNAVAASSTAMNAVAASSTAMNAVVQFSTAISALKTLVALNSLKSSPTAASAVSTLVSNINSGSYTLDTSTDWRGLLVLLASNNGTALASSDGTGATAGFMATLAIKINSAYSANIISSGSPTTALATNEIGLAIKYSAVAAYNAEHSCSITTPQGESGHRFLNGIAYVADYYQYTSDPYYPPIAIGTGTEKFSLSTADTIYLLRYTPT